MRDTDKQLLHFEALPKLSQQGLHDLASLAHLLAISNRLQRNEYQSVRLHLLSVLHGLDNIVFRDQLLVLQLQMRHHVVV